MELCLTINSSSVGNRDLDLERDLNLLFPLDLLNVPSDELDLEDLRFDLNRDLDLFLASGDLDLDLDFLRDLVFFEADDLPSLDRDLRPRDDDLFLLDLDLSDDDLLLLFLDGDDLDLLGDSAL